MENVFDMWPMPKEYGVRMYGYQKYHIKKLIVPTFVGKKIRKKVRYCILKLVPCKETYLQVEMLEWVLITSTPKISEALIVQGALNRSAKICDDATN